MSARPDKKGFPGFENTSYRKVSDTMAVDDQAPVTMLLTYYYGNMPPLDLEGFQTH